MKTKSNSKNSVVKHISTDRDNETFDTGRVLVILVILAMLFMAIWDVVVHHAHFDAQSFGTGAGALLVGLGAYLFGDSRTPPPIVNPFPFPYRPPYQPQPDCDGDGNQGGDDEASPQPKPRKWVPQQKQS